MKGLIIYSSKTGNTQKLAERLYNEFKKTEEIEIYPLGKAKDIDSYDYILLGGWNDRATLNKETLKFLKKLPNIPLGLFITMAGRPNSDHGKKTFKNLEKLIGGRINVGIYLCPGLADPKQVERLKGPLGVIIPKKPRNKMIETCENSRIATESEYEEAIEYFKGKLKELTETQR